MVKRFIVLADLSPASSGLLKAAWELGSPGGAHLLVLHQALEAVPGIGETVILDRMKASVREDALEKLKQFVEVTLGPVENVRCEVTSASLTEAILDLQEPGTVDLIFTGIKHKDFVEKLIMSSTAVKLSDHTEGILVSVPQDDPPLDFSVLNVALMKDFSLNEGALDAFLEVAGTRSLRFFSVIRKNDEDREADGLLDRYVDKYSKRVAVSKEIVRSENAIEQIMSYGNSREGLLVLQKGSRGLADVFRPFTVNAVLYDGHLPVIILPERR